MSRSRCARRGVWTLAAVLTAWILSATAGAAYLSGGTIVYQVRPGRAVQFSREDFRSFFEDRADADDGLRYVTFQTGSALRASIGTMYHDYDGSEERSFTRTSLEGCDFWYRSSRDGDYPLADLSFKASSSAERTTVTMRFTAHGEDRSYSGDLEIRIGSSASSGLSYAVEAGGTVSFDREDLRSYYEDRTDSGSLRYVVFRPDSSLKASNGTIFYDFDGDDERSFDRSELDDLSFYYSSDEYGDYPIARLTFAASSRADGETVTLPFTAYGRSDDCTGTIEFRIGGASGSSVESAALSYSLTAGGSVSFRRGDFQDAAAQVLSGSLRYVTFSTDDLLSDAEGGLYVDRGRSAERAFTRTSVQNYVFYADSPDYGDYALDDLSFAAPASAPARTVELSCAFHDSRGRSAPGTVTIRLYAASSGTSSSSTGGASGTTALPDIVYRTAPGGRVIFDRSLFNSFYRSASGSSGAIRYVTLEPYTTDTSGGVLWADYGRTGAVPFDPARLTRYRFYYDDASYGNYALSSLSFVASESFRDAVSYRFTAWYSSTQKESGILSIQPGGSASGTTTGSASGTTTGNTSGTTTGNTSGTNTGSTSGTTTGNTSGTGSASSTGSASPPDTSGLPSAGTPASALAGDLRYIASYAAPVRIDADELVRWYRSQTSGGRLESVQFLGLPASGALWYDYYQTSRYGSASAVRLDASNIASLSFRPSPASEDQYSLRELLYTPVQGHDTCVTILFSASGTGSVQALRGSILISVTRTAVPEVYGVAPRGSAVSFPCSAISSAVTSATGSAPAGIRLLSLPPASTGIVYQGDAPASTADTYSGESGFLSIGALRFVPAADFTGSVTIPYAALDAQGMAVAAGDFCIGVVSTVKRFTDLPASSWCFKYVTELADRGVVGGYPDGSYQPDRPVTWGAALKLILLAAGWPEQPGTAIRPFDGYLSLAQGQGIVSGPVDLAADISRLEVARVAAAAMKLDLSSLSSMRPFADTDDPSIQALAAAGIVNGYFENGVSTFRPGNGLTRGQAAAIVWRIRNYRG